MAAVSGHVAETREGDRRRSRGTIGATFNRVVLALDAAHRSCERRADALFLLATEDRNDTRLLRLSRHAVETQVVAGHLRARLSRGYPHRAEVFSVDLPR